MLSRCKITKKTDFGKLFFIFCIFLFGCTCKKILFNFSQQKIFLTFAVRILPFVEMAE